MTFRRLVVGFLIVSLAGSLSAQRVRKHIEDLTPPEVDALADAFQHLKDSPEYVKWADIHGMGGPASGCEHNSELLWPWHRAYLLAFEDALRASDPPKTSNVTIRSEEHTSELQSRVDLVCRLLLEKKNDEELR